MRIQMLANRSFVIQGAALFVVVVLAVSQRAAAQAPMGTAFTYQGDLQLDGSPVDDMCVFEFSLWDDDNDPDSGVQVGSTLMQTVDVAAGGFTATLDFGTGIFIGDARFLEVAVCCPSPCGDFTTLAPRQEFTPTPHALALPGLYTQQNATSPNLIGGYNGNTVESGTVAATIAGGGAAFFENRVFDNYGTVGGGQNNKAGSDDANPATAPFATVGGGEDNTASGLRSTVGGGNINTASGAWATAGGGQFSTASGNWGTVGGGQANTASGQSSTVGGGRQNIASGLRSTVPGGRLNSAVGSNSFAAGHRAKADHDGAFVWADSTNADVASTAVDQFLIRAAGGVGIGTTSPTEQLTVAGMIGSTAGGFKLPDGTIIDDASDIEDTDTLGALTCASGEVAKWNGAAWVCAADDNTDTDTLGGLSCASGEVAKWNGSAWACAADTDTDTDTLGGLTCASGEVAKWNGAAWVCADDTDTDTDTLGKLACASGEVAKWNGSTWACAADDAGVGGASTLDEAYDGAGAGAGRTITADAGAVEILGPGGLTVAGTIQSGSSIIIDGTANTIASTGDLELHVNDGRALRLETNVASPNLIGGYSGNSVTTGVKGATIGGGGRNGVENQVFDDGGTIGGGINNEAGSDDANLGAQRYATVGGGENNTASAIWSTVAGGANNTASGQQTTIAGGFTNAASDTYATVGGGVSSTASGFSSVVCGGSTNTASANFATVGGGEFNMAGGAWGMVPGGRLNSAGGDFSFAAGRRAKANHTGAFVWADSGGLNFGSTAVNQFLISAAGGVGIGTDSPTEQLDVAGNIHSSGTISSGSSIVIDGATDTITASSGTISFDDENLVTVGTVSVGSSITINGSTDTITASSGTISFANENLVTTGTISVGNSIIIDGNADTITSNANLELHVNNGSALRLETNAASPNLIGGYGSNSVTPGVKGASIGGGGELSFEHRVFDNHGTIGGGNKNKAGSDDADPTTARWATVSGGSGNTASGDISTVGGGIGNTASGPRSTVSGGSSNDASVEGSTVCGGTLNTASGVRSTVGGGNTNESGGEDSFIGGGVFNTATGNGSTIGGGKFNDASGVDSTIGGGRSNTVSGDWATVPSGRLNSAGGDYSFAAGLQAKANNNGMFVWADNSGFVDFPSATEANFTPTANQFLARTTGGAVFVSAVNGSGDSTAGVELAAGGGSWASLSDRNAKENVRPVDGREVLDKLAGVPVATWNYKAQDESIRHIGPMAQDFSAAFGVGEKETMITTIDADGVALAAIQGLYEMVKEQQDRIAALEKKLAEFTAKEEK